MAIVEIEGLDKPSSLSSEQSHQQPAIKVAGFYTLRKSLQTTSASPWIISAKDSKTFLEINLSFLISLFISYFNLL